MRVHRLDIPRALCKLIEAGVWPDANTPARGIFGQDFSPILGEEAAHALSPDDDHIVMLKPPFRTIADEVARGGSFWVSHGKGGTVTY